MERPHLRLATILLLVLAFGCSGSDDTGNVPDTVVLVKKITETIHAGDFSETRTTEFDYIGNTLVAISTPGATTTFTYLNERIAFGTEVAATGATKTITFTYNGDLLASIADDGDYSETTDFTYTANALSTQTSRYLSGGEWVVSETRNFTFDASGNLASETVAGQFSDFRADYTFDAHPSPFVSLPRAIRQVLAFEGIDAKSANNRLTRALFSPPTATQPSGIQYFEIGYDAAGYPTQIEKFSQDGNPISTTLIEYL